MAGKMGKAVKKMKKMCKTGLNIFTKKRAYFLVKACLVLQCMVLGVVTLLDAYHGYPMYTPMVTRMRADPVEDLARNLGITETLMKYLMGVLAFCFVGGMVSPNLFERLPQLVPSKVGKCPLCTSANCDFDQLSTLSMAATAVILAYTIKMAGETPLLACCTVCVCLSKFALKSNKMGNCMGGQMFKPMKAMKAMKSKQS